MSAHGFPDNPFHAKTFRRIDDRMLEQAGKDVLPAKARQYRSCCIFIEVSGESISTSASWPTTSPAGVRATQEMM